ncbi:hypothetical protein Ciccas_008405, partial [Cichlidogyrus casuarinus]
MSNNESEGHTSDDEKTENPDTDDRERETIINMQTAIRNVMFLDMEQFQELEIARERLLQNSTVFESMIRYCWEGALENLQKLTKPEFKELAVECVNDYDSNGMAPIHYAAKFNKFSCLKTLINDLKAERFLIDNKLGGSALIHAAKTTERTAATSK